MTSSPGPQGLPRFRLLGPVEVDTGGGPLRIRAMRTRALLAALALRPNQVVAADQLLTLLWGPATHGTDRNRLHWQVSRLRRLLRGDGDHQERVILRPPGYLLRVGPGELDLEEFRRLADEGRELLATGPAARAAEALHAALALWRGSALHDVTLPGLAGVADRLEQRRLAALEDRIEADLLLGRHAGLIAELEGLVADHPLRERLFGQLMVALYRSGRQADALGVYRDARRELVERQGLEPGPRLRELERAILTGDAALDLPRPAGAGAAPDRDELPAPTVPVPSMAVPSLLPPDIADFTGRQAHVRSVVELVAGGNGEAAPAVVVSAVAGRAGVGKTALAVHAAHTVRDQFPDGQLYVDLHGAGGRPADPAAVLARFLRVLGMDPMNVPGSLDERAELYRNQLAGRKVLVILDNAAGEAQVAPLLPGSPSCAVLVTSRRRLTGLAGAVHLGLDVMEPEQAVELLGRIAGRERVEREPEAAAELARLCGWLPLALRIAAARLAARPHWQVAQLVERLANERRRLDELTAGSLEVRSSLALGYEALSAPGQALFRRVGLLDAPDVAAWVAAALLDAPVDRAHELLEQLVESHLLDAAVQDGHVARYRFHDLVRLYARERAEAEEPPELRRAALTRAFGAWLHLAEQADARLGNPFVEPIYGDAARWRLDAALTDRLLRDPLAWLESERAALVAAVVQAAGLGLTGLTWELTSALAQFLSSRIHLGDWGRCVEYALAAARANGDRRGEAAVLLSASDLHGFYHRQEQAAACAWDALDAFVALGDTVGQAMAIALLAYSDFFRGRYDKAHEGAKRALVTLGRAGPGRARLCVLRCLGVVQHGKRQIERARATFQDALRLSVELDSQRGAAEMQGRLGSLLRMEGRNDQAVVLLTDAVERLERYGDQMNLTVARASLAEALADLGRNDESRELVSKVMRSRSPLLRGRGFRILGQLHAAEGRQDEAREALHEALRLFRAFRFDADEAETVRAFALLDDVFATSVAGPASSCTASRSKLA